MGLPSRFSLEPELLDRPTALKDQSVFLATPWRTELPVLTGQSVTLREPAAQDLHALVVLLSAPDASRFGLESPIGEDAVQQLIARAVCERAAGRAFTYIVAANAPAAIVGLVQVRQLDPAFESAEWECTIASASRGRGIFLETARLVGSLAFGMIGTHRLEARVQLQNGRANGALRKLGAVQEGVLRRSARSSDQYVDQVLWSMLREDWGDRWLLPASRVH